MAVTIGAGIALAMGVLALGRRSIAPAFAVVVLALVAASSSIGAVKDLFLDLRWAALGALALAVVWPLPRRLEELSFELGVLALTAVTALSAVWSIDPKLTLMRAASFCLLLLGVSRLVRSSAWDPQGIVDAIAVLSGTVAVASVVLWLVRPDIAVYVGELRGVLENQNGLGIFLGLTYPFVLAALDRRIGQRVWLAVATVPCALMIGLTESRTGVLALVTGVVAYEVAARSSWRMVLNVVAALSVFFAGSFLVDSLDGGLGDGERSDVIGRGAAPGQSRLAALLGARDEAWSATGELILDRPLLGYGFGTGDRVFARYPERADFRYFQGANPNNAYLQAGLELGLLLGLMLFVPLLYAAGRNVARAIHERFTVERAAFLACLVGGLVAAVFESLLTAAGAPWAILIWLSAVALLARVRWAPRTT